jgi:hypothetical protein
MKTDDFAPSRWTGCTDSEFGECANDERSEELRHAQELEEAAYRPEQCIVWLAIAVIFWGAVAALFA